LRAIGLAKKPSKENVVFYSAVSKNEILSFADKWMELENIILRDGSLVRKDKSHMFSLICGIQTQHKYKQYYEKQVTLRGGHTQEREGKRRKLRR
jgi:hypothetical protein